MFKALIVEDSLQFQNCLCELLQALYPDMQIVTASDGSELIKKIEALVPHVVFMDIKLPGTNGIELTKQISEARSDIFVVVMTGNPQPEYRDAAHAAGAAHFFHKDELSKQKIDTIMKSLAHPIPLSKKLTCLNG